MAGLLERAFTSAPGKAVAGRLGLAEPPRLRRGRELPAGPVVLASLAGSDLVARSLAELGIATDSPVLDEVGHDPAPAYPARIGALVVDARGLVTIDGLERLRAVLRPAMKALEGSGRVVLIADAEAAGLEASAVHQAIDGINRTVGKELRAGATTNLVRVPSDLDPADLASTLSFLLDGRSAFVDGQAWTVGRAPSTTPRSRKVPLLPKFREQEDVSGARALKKE